MKNESEWQPSKIIPSANGWQSNHEFVGKRSEYVGQLECEAYVKTIEKYAKGALLDIGAGTVPFYGVYKERVTSVECIDWGSSLHELKHIDKLVDANGKLPYKDDEFDTVLLADVLEHIKNPWSLFSETKRVLRSSGNMIVFVPFMYWLHEQPHDYYRYTEFALRDLAESSGLNVVELEEYGGGLDVLFDITQKMAAGINDNSSYEINQNFWNSIISSSIYEEMQQKFKKRFPIGYTLVAQK